MTLALSSAEQLHLEQRIAEERMIALDPPFERPDWYRDAMGDTHVPYARIIDRRLGKRSGGSLLMPAYAETDPPVTVKRKVHHQEQPGRTKSGTRCGMGGRSARRDYDWKRVTCRACIRAERATLSLDGNRVDAQKLDDLLLADANSWYSSVQREGMTL